MTTKGGKTTAKKGTRTKKYTCMCCSESKAESNFYKSPHTKIWNYSNQKVLVCKACVDKLFKEYADTCGMQNAVLILCALLDVPYYASICSISIENNKDNFTFGQYSKLLNGEQYKNKTFADTLICGELEKTEAFLKEEREARWNSKDKRNKNFVLSVVGYDPFEDEGMTELDRKFCYNTLASYCDTDGITEDGHKVQSVIELTQLQLQCRKINELLNSEFLKSSPEETTIKNFTVAKGNLLSSISKIAQDNNISSNSTGTSKVGKSTLSYKMKEMVDNGFDDIEVNLFDIDTSSAMKQIADLSNQSIMEQLTWDSNDYTSMIKEQRETITTQQEKINVISEENRILKNKIAVFEVKKK